MLEYVARASTNVKAIKEDPNAAPDPYGDELIEDPMAGDEFDQDESLNRRTEVVETDTYGSVHARVTGEGRAA